MTTATTLVLITTDPNHSIANHAYRYVSALLMLNEPVSVFFYGNAAHTANALRWQVADKENLTKKWQSLSAAHNMTLPVCVSTALTRGVTDADNAERHQLQGNNLAQGFKLVGLGELADMLSLSSKVIQF